MSRFAKLLLCMVVAASFCLAGAGAATGAEAESQAAPEAAEEPQEEAGGIAAMAGQVQMMAYRMQQEAKEKRLAVLKRLEAGEIAAETALEELDKLPASPAQFATPGKPSAWLAVSINQGAQEVLVSLPLTVVQWLIAEGPKILPTEVKNELQSEGFDLESLNLAPLLIALDSLSYVEETTPLFHVKQGAQEILVTIRPAMSTTGRTTSPGGMVLEE